MLLLLAPAVPLRAQSAGPDWAGTWKGTLLNFPARVGATPVEVTRDVGPLPATDSSCTSWHTTYSEAGVVKAEKAYKLCRGAGADDLYIDEGDGVKLTTRWIGGVLITAFKYNDVLLVAQTRLRGDVMEEEILTVGDQPAATGVVPLLPRGVQRLTLRRADRAPAEDPLRTDWAGLRRYQKANAELPEVAPGEQRVVFMGNSITDSWAPLFATMFAGKPYVGRGISGQTTPQMVLRFHQDVIALKPAAVVILAGTNDIAGNTGPSTLGMIEDNIAAMTELAQAHGIRVVLSSVLPVYDYPWKKGLEPAPKIVALNAWIRQYAADHGAVYLDYHSALADERQGLPARYSADGVHPNEAGYRVMAGLVEAAIAEALRPR